MSYKSAICRIFIRNPAAKAGFIWFFQSEDFLQVSEKKNRAKLICCDVSRLNKPLIQIKNLTVFSTLPPEDASKMQKRSGGVLHGGFVEIIWAVRGDRGYFPPPLLPVCCCAAATNWSLCNGMQNSDKWLLLQYIGSSLWLCLCPWHLLLETDVHYSLTYNGRVLKHLGYSFFPGRLAKHLDQECHTADILQLSLSFPICVCVCVCVSPSHRYITTLTVCLCHSLSSNTSSRWTCVCRCNRLIIIKCVIYT